MQPCRACASWPLRPRFHDGKGTLPLHSSLTLRIGWERCTTSPYWRPTIPERKRTSAWALSRRGGSPTSSQNPWRNCATAEASSRTWGRACLPGSSCLFLSSRNSSPHQASSGRRMPRSSMRTGCCRRAWSERSSRDSRKSRSS